MKNFQFRLAQVRDFRRQQLELEEVKLQSLIVERQALEAESGRLEAEVAGTRRFLMVTGSAQSQDLMASDLYLRHLATEQKRQAAKLVDWHTRALQQRQAIVEARRRLRLLEHLERKRFRAWQAQVDREQENLAAELYLGRRGKL